MDDTNRCTSEPQPEVASGYDRVRIERAANGFIIKVGCQTFVAKTWEEASKGLSDYWNDPLAAEKKYLKN